MKSFVKVVGMKCYKEGNKCVDYAKKSKYVQDCKQLQCIKSKQTQAESESQVDKEQ